MLPLDNQKPYRYGDIHKKNTENGFWHLFENGCQWVWFTICAYVPHYILLIMADLLCTCGHYIFVQFLSSLFLLGFNLSGRRLDVYHTSTHGVALVRILGCRSEMCCTRLAGNTGCKK